MHLVCLCPTYGRPSMPANAAALFLSQRLRVGDTAELIIFDDAGQIAPQTLYDCIHVISQPTWRPLPQKYPAMVAWMASTTDRRIDAWVIWDDDDVYLPWHLAATANALDLHPWSHPSVILSTYGIDPLQEAPREESSAGRFHGAAAVRASTLIATGGWCAQDRADYDQVHLHRWRAAGPAGDPYAFAEHSYVYRWGDTQRNHCSGNIRQNRYQQPPIQEPGQVAKLVPDFDRSTKAILQRLVPFGDLPF
jgi:hypothetical protein